MVLQTWNFDEDFDEDAETWEKQREDCGDDVEPDECASWEEEDDLEEV
jgi:hypothetical protein